MKTVSFVAIATPLLVIPGVTANAQDAPKSTLTQTLMQAQLDKCLERGTITMERIQALNDDAELAAALDTCSKSPNIEGPAAVPTPPRIGTAPAPASNQALPPVAPATSMPPTRSVTNSSLGPSGGSAGFGVNGDGGEVPGAADVGQSGVNIDVNILKGKGGTNKEATGGPIGGVNVPAGTGGAVPPTKSVDARVRDIQHQIDKGTELGAFTPEEMKQLELELRSAQQANQTPGQQAEAQKQLDQADADFIKFVHNNPPSKNVSGLTPETATTLAASRGIAGGSMLANIKSSYKPQYSKSSALTLAKLHAANKFGSKLDDHGPAAGVNSVPPHALQAARASRFNQHAVNLPAKLPAAGELQHKAVPVNSPVTTAKTGAGRAEHVHKFDRYLQHHPQSSTTGKQKGS